MLNRNKRLSLTLLLLVVSVILIACGSKEGMDLSDNSLGLISVEDDYGNIIQLDQEVERVVSLSPSTTEILFAIGLDKEIVGVTDFCDYPEKAKTKEKIGGYIDPDIEKIISLSPDIVIVSGSSDREKERLLYDAGIQVATFNSSNIEEIFEEIKSIGELTSKSEEANSLVNDLDKRKEKILRKVKKNSGKKVFYEVWHDPLTTAGKGSFMDELIGLSGAINIGHKIDQAYPQYSLESLISENPDIYISTDGGVGRTKEDIKSRDLFSNIRAVEEDKVYIIDGDIASRPGPRIIDALEIIVDIVKD